MEKKRDLQFDIVCVLATFWIVGVWHVSDYWNLPNAKELIADTGNSTTVVLATFMFMSGYFLSKYTFNTKQEVFTFYKKRLIRFFPLFFFAALLMYRLGINPELKCLFYTITGLSSYVGCPPTTIWFISLLFSFYMLTPVVSNMLSRMQDSIISKTVVVVLSSILFILLLSVLNPNYDIRITYTLPFYWLGLIYGKTSIIKCVTSKIYTLVGSIVLLVMCVRFNICGPTFLHVDALLGMVALLSICYWLKFLPVGKAVEILSYASMCMYLFHRPIYHLTLKYLLHEDKASTLELYCILLPVVVILSYFIQYAYDKTIKKIGW